MNYKSIFPRSFKNFLKNSISENHHPPALSYSQSGEDSIIYSFFKHKILNNGYKGFYVDIGANEPVNGSNSFFFYARDWKGIAVDADKNVITRFKSYRPEDICITAAISDKEEELDFYIFEGSENWGNTFIKPLNTNASEGVFRVEKRKTISLNCLLEQYLPENTEIDFLDIDVEGFEFKILQAFDFEKYHPKLILVEMEGFDVKDCFKTPLFELITSNNYTFIARTNLGGNIGTSIFIKSGLSNF
jgi:FkbM family methyltransferase